MQLRWSEASFADRGALQAFVCTYPAKPRRDLVTKAPIHPQPWQLRVQAGLRGLRPPLTPPARLIVGYTDDDLAAVGMFEERADDEAFYIRAVARAQQFKGCRIADELLAHLLETMAATPRVVEQGWRDVFCEIHWKNHASKALFERFGFECVDRTDELETWVMDFSLLVPSDPDLPTQEDYGLAAADG